MAGKGKPITYRIFIGGVPVEQIPQKDLCEWQQRRMESAGEAASRYCRENPSALDTIRGKDYASFLPGK